VEELQAEIKQKEVQLSQMQGLTTGASERVKQVLLIFLKMRREGMKQVLTLFPKKRSEGKA
jgi:hypothetical protein